MAELTKTQKTRISELAKAFGFSSIFDYAYEHEIDEHAVLYNKPTDDSLVALKSHAELLAYVLRQIDPTAEQSRLQSIETAVAEMQVTLLELKNQNRT